MVSVDVKHHVYLLNFTSLISLVVSVDVKHHVCLLALSGKVPSKQALKTSITPCITAANKHKLQAHAPQTSPKGHVTFFQ